ncbi:unnamed protein product [Rotaria sordida]|uniref:Uncharacterized protein n=2 Tax=Rotaria sordida TaxID=392033 RepID=A0A815XEH5_9BILA|nr:unnamed protein product [Rotaria sordida]
MDDSIVFGNTEYLCNNMQAILLTQLEKSRQQFPECITKPIHVLSDISDTTEGEMEQCLQNEKKDHSGDRITLIPYHLENSYSIGILIEFGSDNQIKRAEYINPVNGPNTVPDRLQQQLAEVYPNAVLKAIDSQMHGDKTKSAELTIYNLLKSVNVKFQKADVEEKNRNESPFILTVQTLVGKKNNIQPLENNLQVMQQSLDNIISTQLANIADISSVETAVTETRDKVVKTQSTSQDITKSL